MDKVFERTAEYHRAYGALLDGGHAEAEAIYRRLLAEDNSSVARFYLSQVLLCSGQYREGWAEYECRTQRPVPFPRWRGEPLDGRTILLHGEQGFGDNIQFLRYLPMVAARGGRIVLACRAGIESLLAPLPGIAEIATEGAPVAADVECPLMSLPFVFGTTLDTIPVDLPYLAPPAASIRYWRRRLAGPDLKVGLVWAGNPAFSHDRIRSPGLRAMLPLLSVPGVRFFGLQVGHGRSHLASVRMPPQFTDLAAELTSFGETAAALTQLDLVISSCTSVAHLCGALGRPLWVLLSRMPDWRWMTERDDSPWYPTARLFRQDELGDWLPPVMRMCTALAAMAAAVAEPPEAAAALGEAVRSLEAGRLDDADRLARQALAAHPHYAQALDALGRVALRRGDAGAAAELFEAAARLRPQAADFHLHRGLACRALGHHQAARIAFHSAAACEPGRTDVAQALAEMKDPPQ